ncbi:ATP synthase subunit O, mitochondrial-like isoform X1 [Salvia miltiorrhiza]|uniref:ATP synthase subunit O, mitochondrial-like isoform X1 n=1 Tax=Salvia miltiorrhiza TaxID=226208 RepID=UPI0025ABDA80|nr:ATP synthase subunit O, mitochondrial-like isoform X1 [Salvia miltiorrhiza]
MATRMRSGLRLLRRALFVESSSTASERSVGSTAVLSSGSTLSEFTRNYASVPASKPQKVKVPVTMFGVSGNYASALYIAAVKANVLDKVESELLTLVEASKASPTFAQFMKDASVTSDTRVKAINDICGQAKFSDITKNFMAVVAEAGRLGHLGRMVQRFSELTMAHRGEVKVTVTTVIVSSLLECKCCIYVFSLSWAVLWSKRILALCALSPNDVSKILFFSPLHNENLNPGRKSVSHPSRFSLEKCQLLSYDLPWLWGCGLIIPFFA